MIAGDAIDNIRVNGYDIIAEIGHGSNGDVYYAIQTSLRRPVALKIMADHLASDSSYVKQFFHEAQAAAQLSHPNVVRAYDVGYAESEHFFFSMELIEGEDLQSILKDRGQLEWRESLEYLKFVASALDYGMKKCRLTHGDIKPANIMVTHRDEVKLADLGLACLGGETKSEDIMLTPHYAAPEVIGGTWQIGDCRADIYSFGATLYHLITGSPVFEGENSRDIIKKHLKSSVINAGVYVSLPQGVCDFLSKLLRKSPDERFQNWQGVIDEIDRLLKTNGSSYCSKSKSRKKYHLDKERRKRAMERLKKRKKNKVMSYYFGGLAAIITFVFISDLVIAMIGGGGAWQLIEMFVKNIAGI